MKNVANKYFFLGVIALLLISIPLTMYFVKQQQDVRTQAAPTSTLTLTPPDSTISAGEEFPITVRLDPGKNIVSYVKFNLLYDPQKLEVVTITPSTSFPLTLEGPTITSGSTVISLGIGSDVTKAIQAPTDVAVVTFKALQETGGQAIQVTFDPGATQVLSLSSDDQAGENVLANASPANVTVLQGATPSTTPAPSPSIIPSPTTQVSDLNNAPVCTNLLVAPQASGSAPLSVTLSANGSDSDGLISKATFDFGDGQAQDVTDGMNIATVSSQVTHTYQNMGTFNASVVFTDDKGAISQSCTQTISVAAGAPTEEPTQAPTAPTDTAKPTLPATGSVATTIGVIGGILLTVLGGIFLFTL